MCSVFEYYISLLSLFTCSRWHKVFELGVSETYLRIVTHVNDTSYCSHKVSIQNPKANIFLSGTVYSLLPIWGEK